MITNVVVIGNTPAGVMTALALKAKIPELHVRVIRDADPQPLVNEPSSLALTRFLHAYLQIDFTRFIRSSKSNWTLGRLMQWGPREHLVLPYSTQLDQRLPSLPRNNAFYADQDFDCAGALFALLAYDRPFFRLQNGQPAWHWDVGYQNDASLFVHTLTQFATAIGVEFHDDTLAGVSQNETGIGNLTLASGQSIGADLYVDCSGSRSLLLGRELKEPFVSFKSSTPCDRLLIAEWGRIDEPIHPHSFCDTMRGGWGWQVEIIHRIDCGYAYSSGHISDEEAEQEFRVKWPKIVAPRMVVISSGRFERAWVKNVVAIGASAGYIEPLAATGLSVAAAEAQLLVETISEGSRIVSAAPIKLYNRHHARIWDSLRRYSAIHYKYNVRLETPFWQHCRKETDLAGAETIVEYYRQCGPSSLWGPMLVDPVDLFTPPGYLALLLGLKVPTKFNQTITANEREAWEAECNRFRSAATSGVTVVDALSMLPATGSASGRSPLAAAAT